MDNETQDTAENPSTDSAPETRNRQVQLWESRVRHAKKQHENAFKRMRDDMKFARGIQWKGQDSLDDERYRANMVQRHLRQREAALYAKNPKAVAKRRRTLDYVEWDGDPQSLQQAQMTLQATEQALQQLQAGELQASPQDMQQALQQYYQARQLVEDYQQGSQRQDQLDRMAKTMEVVWEHQVGEQQPPFKTSMKKLVRRTLTTGVGYVKLGYHRFNEPRPEDQHRVTDLTEQISALRVKIEEAQEEGNDIDQDSAQLAELEDNLRKVQQDQTAFIREGLDLDFPRSTALIPDPSCYELEGFLGARWVAQEFLLTTKEINEIYSVKVEKNFTPHDPAGNPLGHERAEDFQKEESEQDVRAVVWEIWDKHMGQVFTICQGHSEFLQSPDTPKVHLERFWPFFVLVFNGLEDEDHLFPPSDVALIKDMQREHNLMRQRLREHRDAARPGYAAPRGRLDHTDKGKLEDREAHQVVEINGLAEQDDIRRILQPIPTNPIDPNQYEVASLQDDIYKVVGTSEAVMGGTSGATATESSIAESSRLSSIGSAVDELDDLLTELAKYASHLFLTEMSREKVKEIAGRGAVWPDVSGEDVAKDLWLEIRAGSSGRPNKASEIQNLERVAPYLMQVPGVKPYKMLDLMLERLDDRLEAADFFDPNLDSMTAMNRQAEIGTGDPGTDPNQQGGEGGDKTSSPRGESARGPAEKDSANTGDPNTGDAPARDKPGGGQ